MTGDGGTTARLCVAGMPFVDAQLRHPTVQALEAGKLDDAAARAWLEQDYLYLHEEIRFLTRLTWQAPRHHRPELLRLAWTVFDVEIPFHRELSEPFGADLENAVMAPVTRSYTRWLLDAAADYSLGLTAYLAGVWGYSTLGQRLNVPSEPRFKRWVESYQGPEFPTLAERVAIMVSEADPDPDLALRTFLTGMAHEIAFWDTP